MHKLTGTAATTGRHTLGRLLLAGVLVGGLCVLSVADPLAAPGNAAGPGNTAAPGSADLAAAAARSAHFGAAVEDLDGFLGNAAAQDALKNLGVPILSVTARSYDVTDAHILAVLSAVQRTGAVPYLRLSLPWDTNATGPIRRWVELTKQKFGDTKVYLEFSGGTSGGMREYADVWNATIPSIKPVAPASYLFIAKPDMTPDFGKIAAEANPRPDALAWGESLCSRDVSDEVCERRIPTWRWHVERTNAVVRARIGHTIPVFISSWNIAPHDDERFLANAPTRKLTQAALAQLVSLKSLGLIGATMSPAVATNLDEDHFGRGLVHRDGSLTLQGAAYRDKV